MNTLNPDRVGIMSKSQAFWIFPEETWSFSTTSQLCIYGKTELKISHPSKLYDLDFGLKLSLGVRALEPRVRLCSQSRLSVWLGQNSESARELKSGGVHLLTSETRMKMLGLNFLF